MFPLQFNCKYDKESSVLSFFPHPRVAQQWNINSIDLHIRDLNKGNIVIQIRSVHGEDYHFSSEIIARFIDLNTEYESTEHGVIVDNANPSQPFYLGRLDTEGLEVKKEEAIQLIKDFFKSCLKVLNISNDSKRNLNSCLNEALGTKNFQYIEINEKAPFFPSPPKPGKSKFVEHADLDNNNP